MSAKKSGYFCSECGHFASRWMGRCAGCGQWNTYVEEVLDNAPGRRGRRSSLGDGVEPLPVTEISLAEEERHSTGLGELDRVLGGGLVSGSLVLLGGDPGIGKSTLLLQAAGSICAGGQRVLYVTGEESARQVRLRADRLGSVSPQLYLYAETDLEKIEQQVGRVDPLVMVVDSIQTMYGPDLTSSPGSVSQVRDCTARLLRLAKEKSISVFVIGHVTKEGMIAGPRVMEHTVDVVLYLEGERHQSFRILRGVKNRYGSTNEIGIFEMSGTGLREVTNPSSFFLMDYTRRDAAGSVVVPTMEGTRPLLVEVQALVSPTSFGVPRRMTTGVDHNRVALIMAVLEKRMGFMLGNCDAYVNVVGGVRIDEPAVDLGIAAALASSFKELVIDEGTVMIGELGLTGEIRPVSAVEKRVREAARLGFKRCVVPRQKDAPVDPGLHIAQASTLAEAFGHIFG